jgi:hypothetical protein
MNAETKKTDTEGQFPFEAGDLEADDLPSLDPARNREDKRGTVSDIPWIEDADVWRVVEENVVEEFVSEGMSREEAKHLARKGRRAVARAVRGA